MGGKEGSRGYLYQAIASVLDMLTDKRWDKIYIEPNTAQDKVDIAISSENMIFRAIQVKSTQNSFSPADVKSWIIDMYNDYSAAEYELVLIGQSTKSTLLFKTAIENYQCNKSNLNQTSQDALNGFDTSILDNSAVTIRFLPYDIQALTAILIVSLLKYLSDIGILLPYIQLDLLSKALIAEQFLHSTNGSYTERPIFEDDINTRIQAISNNVQPKRTALAIRSFSRDSTHDDVEETNILDIIHLFNGRFLKSEFSWSVDIVELVSKFLASKTNNTDKFKIYLETHGSIAFLAGRILDTKSGIDMITVQKTRANGTVPWSIIETPTEDFQGWDVKNTLISEEASDTILIINISHDIESEVLGYIGSANFQVSRLLVCNLPQKGASNISIQNGDHAVFLANEVCSLLKCRTIAERKGTLHVFTAAPNSFMFHLGAVSHGFGKVKLYEYDFEQADTCTYAPSITFNYAGG